MPSAKRIRTRKRTQEESSIWGSPAQVIASNDDLLSDILVRLPVKSLLRFKSVSKKWLSLISDPHFIRRKSLKSNPVSALLAFNEDRRKLRYDAFPLQGKAPLTTLTFADPPHHGLAIISSCKGLLLCSTSLELYSSETKYYIYNATTRQFRTLPPPVQAAHNMQVIGFCLAFDPIKSHSYRVACGQRLAPSSHLFQLVVYSSETGRWRVSGAPFSLAPYAKFHQAVYCHGGIHWIPTPTGNGASQCFDLDKELGREILLPPPPPPPPPPGDSAVVMEVVIAYFGESGGHLHLVELFNHSTTQFPIYEMESDCSGWFVKFQVDLTAVILPHSCIYSQLLYLARGEKEEDSFLFLHVSGHVIRYNIGNTTQEVMYSTSSRRKLIECNFSNQTCNVIGKTTCKIKSSLGWYHVYQYIESLSLV